MPITVAQLKDKLEQHGVPIPKRARKSDLIDLCRRHRLVRDRQVSTKAVRREWLVAALAEVGCELRGDSRLCEQYIEHGVGDIDDICTIMREMKFYYERTDYPAILDRARSDAEEAYHRALDRFVPTLDRDYDHDVRPSFYDYFDPQDASEEAKRAALARWAFSQPARDHAATHPDLPETLREDVRAMLFTPDGN